MRIVKRMLRPKGQASRGAGVFKLRSSTGIYGTHVGGPVPNNAVKTRRGRR